MLFEETIVVYCENNKKQIYEYAVGRMHSFRMLKQVVCIITTGL